MSPTIGVDIGGTKIAAGLVDEAGVLLATVRRATPAGDAAQIEAEVAQVVAALRAGHEVDAVGVAAAGFVDSVGGRVLFAPNLAWRDAPMAEGLSRRIGLPVVLENDANAATWGEFRFGAAREAAGLRSGDPAGGADAADPHVPDDLGDPRDLGGPRDMQDMVLVTVGTGLGGGIVVGGRLVRGAHGIGGELGHLRMVPDGLRCGCGNRGCWEQYASGSALEREARELVTSGSPHAELLDQLCDGHPKRLRGSMVTQAAREGDPAATELLADLGRWLGEGMASVAAVLDPSLFVIGGGVVEAGDLLVRPAQAALNRNLPARGHRPAPQVRAATLGNTAGMIGVADLARMGG